MTHSLFRFPFTHATIAHPLLATTHFHHYKRFPLTATTLTPNRRKVPSSAALAYAQSMLCTLAGRRTPTPSNPQFSPFRTEARGAQRGQGRGRDGMLPHGGFAIGLERITASFLGIANVKECSMFPRDINRVAP